MQGREARGLLLGGELREEYEENYHCRPTIEGGGDAKPGEELKGTRGGGKRKRKFSWGPRLKYLIDLISFFTCYKCVDHLMYSLGVAPMSDISQSILEGLPSQISREEELPNDGGGARHATPVAGGGGGQSYACSNIMSALDNPYASDVLNWMARNVAGESEEARGWIENASEGGWDGGGGCDDAGACPAADGDRGDSVDGAKDVADGEGGGEDAPAAVFRNPPLLGRRRFLSARDDEYLRAIISTEAYYELVGEPEPRFTDPSWEMTFLLACTAACFGLLSFFRIPFLLI